MVTVKDVWIKAGYSSKDHLNDDGPAKGLIGRTFRSGREARRAAERAAGPGNPTNSPVGVEVILVDGSTQVV